MRLSPENKAAVPTATTCHHCAGAVGWPRCRQEHLGWFCRQRGLITGEGVETLGPAPVVEPWESSAAVVAAAAAEDSARAAFDQADAMWQKAYQRLHQRDQKTERWVVGESGVEPQPGGEDADARWILDTGLLRLWRPGKHRKLIETEEAAQRVRDEAGDALRAARAAYSEALRRAEWHHRTASQAVAVVVPV